MSCRKSLFLQIIFSLVLTPGTVRADGRIEYEDYDCSGVMDGEFPRTFRVEVRALPLPDDRSLTILEVSDDGYQTVWTEKVRTALMIDSRGMYYLYLTGNLRLEAYIGATNPVTRVFPAYMGYRNGSDTIVVEELACL